MGDIAAAWVAGMMVATKAQAASAPAAPRNPPGTQLETP